MKKLFFCLLISSCAFAQEEVKLNQLLAPSSPAFNLLGISPERIERPTNPTDFALSLNNASQNFNVIPSNYAMEIAPYLMLHKKSMRWEHFIADSLASNIKQSFVLSIGTATATSKLDSGAFSQLATGFKVSLLRGHTTTDYKTWQKSADSVFQLMNIKYYDILKGLQAKDVLYNTLMNGVRDSTKTLEEKQQFAKLAEEHSKKNIEPKADKEIRSKNDSVRHAFISKLAKNTNFTRIGWKADLAGGIVFKFPGNNYYNGAISRGALWLTIGYDNPKKTSLLACGRLNVEYHKTMINDSGMVIRFVNSHAMTMDGGLKLIHNFTDKFYITLEGIMRAPRPASNVFKTNNISLPKKTERYTLALNYNVGNNQNLSLTFGKDFDNSLENKKTLIAFLTYIIGIGSARAVN